MDLDEVAEKVKELIEKQGYEKVGVNPPVINPPYQPQPYIQPTIYPQNPTWGTTTADDSVTFSSTAGSTNAYFITSNTDSSSSGTVTITVK